MLTPPDTGPYHITVRIVTPEQEDREPYAFVEFEHVRSAVAAIEEMQFRVSAFKRWRSVPCRRGCNIIPPS